MSEQEMFQAGLRVGMDYSAVGIKAIDAAPEIASKRVFTKPYEYTKKETKKKESIEVAHARWCFERGVLPSTMEKHGLGYGAIHKGIKIALKDNEDKE